MFSRAREGMYIVGNLTSIAECSFKGGRELWSNLKLINCLDINFKWSKYMVWSCSRWNNINSIKVFDSSGHTVLNKHY